MKRLITAVLAICAVVMVCIAQKTTRPNLKKAKETITIEAEVDSTEAVVKALRISGYEKAQHSSSESMFVTNTSAIDITGINITVTYLNMRGEILHQRTETIDLKLPQGETRIIDLKSWDKQRLWHYKLSHAKHNDYSNPFDVKVRVNYVTHYPATSH